MSTDLLQPLSEYDGPKNERVERKDCCAIAGYILVGRINLLIETLQAFFAKLFVMR